MVWLELSQPGQGVLILRSNNTQLNNYSPVVYTSHSQSEDFVKRISFLVWKSETNTTLFASRELLILFVQYI